MFVKTTNGQIDQYPYTVGNLRRDNPNTSFPKRPSDDLLAGWGVYPVANVDSPAFNHATQNLTEGAPVLVDGQWQQTWVITDATPEEVTQRAAQQADDTRSKRDKLLADTDWMALSDNTLTDAWATYRQALRDIKDHVNFPYLADEDWPVKPA
jgi:hypothetical protein